MEVIVIESGAYKELVDTLALQRTLFLEVVSELKTLKNEKYWSVSDVMEFTGFSKDWVLARKEHFGFFQDGKDLKFYKPNVMRYLELRSVAPKVNRQLLKLKSRSA